ncbi:hypothetical protein AGLY_010969 [Aphis glycines]|uniref:Uncharacterized protein n=1 Tax=Aphis glycines TaxID=307491 RepID=A0A6G0TEB9_APHGL|nr:hypothetical protein AGLY_010969 [Aphis glycines]
MARMNFILQMLDIILKTQILHYFNASQCKIWNWRSKKCCIRVFFDSAKQFGFSRIDRKSDHHKCKHAVRSLLNILLDQKHPTSFGNQQSSHNQQSFEIPVFLIDIIWFITVKFYFENIKVPSKKNFISEYGRKPQSASKLLNAIAISDGCTWMERAEFIERIFIKNDFSPNTSLLLFIQSLNFCPELLTNEGFL